jgi:hypothetical protein
MEYRRLDSDLYILYQKNWYKIDLNGTATINVGVILTCTYKDGLPVYVVIQSDTQTEHLEFSDGLLCRRTIETKQGTRVYHYYFNVLVAETKAVENKPIVMRNRTRAMIKQNDRTVDYAILDNKFWWLLSLEPDYKDKAEYGAPPTFNEYMKFYKSMPRTQYKIMSYAVKSGGNGYTVKWDTIDGVIDGNIIATDAFSSQNYKATVTRGVLEEESVLNFRYVYSEGKVLTRVFINDSEVTLNKGLLNSYPYKNGFLIPHLRDTNNIANMRFNIPDSDPTDDIRTRIRNVLPLSSFE